MVRQDGVAPPESEDSWVTASPATTYGILTQIHGGETVIADGTAGCKPTAFLFKLYPHK